MTKLSRCFKNKFSITKAITFYIPQSPIFTLHTQRLIENRIIIHVVESVFMRYHQFHTFLRKALKPYSEIHRDVQYFSTWL